MKAFKKITIFIIMITMLFGCKNDDDAVKIGVILPLTGTRSSFGQSSKTGIDLAVKEINSSDSNNVSFELSYMDSKGEAKTAVSSIHNLLTKKIRAIIGPISSSEVLSVTPIAEKNKIVLLSPGASSPKISNSGDYIFRNVPSDVYEGKLMAKFAFDSLGLKKIAILYNNSDYGIGVKDAFAKSFKQIGGNVILKESFPDASTDFKTQLIKIKQKKPDGLYFIGYKELGIMIKQAKEINVDCQYLTTAIFEDESILNVASNAAEGIIFTSITFDSNNPNKRSQKFVSSYKQKYNKIPDGYAAVAYDAVYIIFKALEISKSNKIELKDVLYKIDKFPGLLGDFKFDKNGDVVLPIKVKTVYKSKFINY